MARPLEVRFMRRNEVLWPSAMWRIPAEHMKMGRPHRRRLYEKLIQPRYAETGKEVALSVTLTSLLNRAGVGIFL
jgi:integrase